MVERLGVAFGATFGYNNLRAIGVFKMVMPFTRDPGVAELVPRLLWEQEIARSNRVTRTKPPGALLLGAFHSRCHKKSNR